MTRRTRSRPEEYCSIKSPAAGGAFLFLCIAKNGSRRRSYGINDMKSLVGAILRIFNGETLVEWTTEGAYLCADSRGIRNRGFVTKTISQTPEEVANGCFQNRLELHRMQGLKSLELRQYQLLQGSIASNSGHGAHQSVELFAVSSSLIFHYRSYRVF